MGCTSKNTTLIGNYCNQTSDLTEFAGKKKKFKKKFDYISPVSIYNCYIDVEEIGILSTGTCGCSNYCYEYVYFFLKIYFNLKYWNNLLTKANRGACNSNKSCICNPGW